MTWRSSGRLQRRRIRDTGLQQKHSERLVSSEPLPRDEGVTSIPGGRRGLAASDLAEASQERQRRRGCSFADFWWATQNIAC